MGIDVLKLNENGLLPALGAGDWLITLPDNYPDMLITQQWRQELRDDAASEFVRWVMNGKVTEIRNRHNPPWDHSGQAYQEQVDPSILLTRYEILHGWLYNEYTGAKRPSYASGMGWWWDRYAEIISNNVDHQVFELLEAHLQSVLEYDEDDDIWMEKLDKVTWLQSQITHAIMIEIGLISTKTAWQTFKNEVRVYLKNKGRYKRLCRSS